MKKFTTLILCLFVAVALHAIPVKPGQWKTIRLANGTEIKAEFKGDEHGHWWQAADGKCYVKVAQTDYYEEAAKEQLQKKAQMKRAKRATARKNKLRSRAKKAGTFTGNQKCLIILVEYADQSFEAGHDQALFNNVANAENYSENGYKGSVKDYFKAQSNGTFVLDFDVVGPVKLSQNYSYYGQNDSRGDDLRPGAMVVEALDSVKNQVNFADYDWDGDGEVEQVYVLYSGKGEADGGDDDTIWPHEWSLSGNDYGDVYTHNGITIDTYACGSELSGEGVLGGIGTFCHEFSHCLGFPDMYDTKYSGFFGMGHFDLMSGGSYNGDGFQPAEYTAYERMIAGWTIPTELVNDTVITSMEAVNKQGETFIIYNKAYPDEYYLIENRQKTGFDEALPSSGLMITHVDYDEWAWFFNIVNSNCDYTHYSTIYPEDADYYDHYKNDHERCTIFHADNSTSYESRDLYPYAGNDSLTNKSRPAATLYNSNTDGKKFMNIRITNITKNSDGTMSFNFGKIVPQPSNHLFYESFDDCDGTGGNDNAWSGSVASSTLKFKPDNDGWTALENKNYGGDQCAKFGTNSVKGTATTPEFTVNGTATFTFRAAPFGSDKKTLTLSTNNPDVTISPATFTMRASQWTDFTATLTGTGNVKVTFTPAKRLFLDEVMADDPTATAIKELPTVNPTVANGRIYTIDGRFVGTDFSVLKKGIYIVDGKKVVIK